jgi:hypothetical protein
MGIVLDVSRTSPFLASLPHPYLPQMLLELFDFGDGDDRSLVVGVLLVAGQDALLPAFFAG